MPDRWAKFECGAHRRQPREHFQATLYYCQQLALIIILMRANIIMCILLFAVLFSRQGDPQVAYMSYNHRLINFNHHVSESEDQYHETMPLSGTESFFFPTTSSQFVSSLVGNIYFNCILPCTSHPQITQKLHSFPNACCVPDQS